MLTVAKVIEKKLSGLRQGRVPWVSAIIAVNIGIIWICDQVHSKLQALLKDNTSADVFLN